MDPQQWEKVKDLFELGEPMTPAERELLLAKEPDDVVRKEAARLLKINPVEAFIDQPVMSPEYLDRFSGHAALLAEDEMLGSRYKIEKRIASGGMGDVYAAYDKDLRERVAIKTIRQDILSNPAIVSRFRREISLARRVAHPNVCKVYDLSQEKRSSDGRTVDFLTMELVEGETLAQWLKREAPVGFEVARPLLEQICAGLAAAHDAGVVHRDFKGSNVLIAKRTDGSLRAVVTDFGLARSVSAATGVSQESSTGLAGGTPAYMAPEQMEGRTVGPKADLYALGIVMYEMATGTAPHTGDSPLQIAVRRVTEKPQSPRKVNPDIDPSWEEAILRCLEYKPEDRPADARAVVALFGKDRPLFTVPRWRMPRWLVPALAGAAVVALGAWWWMNRPPEHSEEAMRWYRKGTDALMDGAYSTARASFEQALKLEPGFGVARARLADTFYELDLLEESKAEIKDVSGRNRQEQLLVAAIRDSLQHRHAQALAAMDELIAKSEKTEYLLDRARILDRWGQMAETVAAYDRVLKKDPSLPGARLRRAVALRTLGKIPEAMRDLKAADEGYVGNPEGKATALLHRAKWEPSMPTAVKLAREARELARGAGSSTLEVRSEFQVAYFLARSGETEEAQRTAEGAVALAKGKNQAAAAASGLGELAYIPYSQGKYGEAATAYKAALDFAETNGARSRAAELQRSLGDSLARDGRVDEGIAWIEQAQQFHLATGRALDAVIDQRYLADCDYMAGRKEKSLQRLRNALDTARKTPGGEPVALRIRLAMLAPLYSGGEYPEVIQLAEELLPHYQATNEKSKEMSIRLNYVGSLRHLGRFEQAAEALRPVLNSPQPYRDLATVEEQRLIRDQGRIAEAIVLAEKDLRSEGSGLKPGNDHARKLCTLHALSDTPEKAAPWCFPLLPITSTGSSSAGALQAAIFRIHATRGNWKDASKAAKILMDWAEAQSDPEMRLLAHLLTAAAASQGGKVAPSVGLLQSWRAERARLEARWGVANVRGMLQLPMFRNYAPVVGGFNESSQ